MKHKQSPKPESPISRATTKINVIIETPKGYRNKIKFDSASRAFKLSKVMPEGMIFPYDFGFVPGTQAEDGDPIDVLVLTDEALFPGCRVDCRLVGVIEAEQEEAGKSNRNDRLIAVAEESLLYSDVKSVGEITPTVLKQIESFFVNYQRVRNIKVKILGTRGPEEAFKLLAKTRKKAA